MRSVLVGGAPMLSGGGPLLALRGGVGPTAAALPPALLRAATAAPSGGLAEWWAEHQTFALSLLGALALLAPALRGLPKTAAVTAAVLVATIVQMAFDLPPDLVLLEAVIALVACGVLTMKDALDGFRSEGVVTVGVMCAVAKGIQQTGGLQLVTKYLLGTPGGYESALLRSVVVTMLISAL
jgi:hypothetical protein